MSRHVFPMPDMLIPEGETESNILTADGLIVDMAHDGDGYRDADDITIFSPEELAEVATVYIDDGPAGDPDNFVPLVRDEAIIVLTANESQLVDRLSFRQMKIVLDGAADADRTFKLNKGVWV